MQIHVFVYMYVCVHSHLLFLYILVSHRRVRWLLLKFAVSRVCVIYVSPVCVHASWTFFNLGSRNTSNVEPCRTGYGLNTCVRYTYQTWYFYFQCTLWNLCCVGVGVSCHITISNDSYSLHIFSRIADNLIIIAND